MKDTTGLFLHNDDVEMIPINYPDHFEDDIIIPSRITQKTTFITSWALLGTAILGFVYEFNVIGVVLLTVWLTSIFHWHNPRFSTIARRLDFAAVFAAIAYGAYFSSKLREQYFLSFCVGITIVGAIFICNETMYYLRVSKNPTGEDIVTKWSTTAGTEQRETAYWQTAIVHSICVHCLANGLVAFLICSAHEDPDVTTDTP